LDLSREWDYCFSVVHKEERLKVLV
jgi:hypothetical protein